MDEITKLLNDAEIYGLTSVLQPYGENINVQIPLKKSLCDTPIDDIGLSVRSRNGSMRAGATTVGKLAELIMSEKGLGQVRNLGKKSISEIKTVILVRAYEKLNRSEKLEFWSNFIAENAI